MTNEEIDKLPAGQELDILIAERVMGWERLPERPNRQRGFATEEYQNLRWRLPNGEVTLDLDYFSTDISEAWQVVEKLYLHVGPFGDYWYASDVHNWNDARIIVHAFTAPLAICRASLKAVLGT